MVAVEGGHIEVVKLFLKLDYQCDTNIQEKVSHTHDIITLYECTLDLKMFML